MISRRSLAMDLAPSTKSLGCLPEPIHRQCPVERRQCRPYSRVRLRKRGVAGHVGQLTVRPFGTKPGDDVGMLRLSLQNGSLTGQSQEAPYVAPDAYIRSRRLPTGQRSSYCGNGEEAMSVLDTGCCYALTPFYGCYGEVPT